MIEINPYVRFVLKFSEHIKYNALVMAYDFRLFYILDGSCAAGFAERKIELNKYSLLIIPPCTPYRLLYGGRKARYYIINFDLDTAYTDIPPQRPSLIRDFDRTHVTSEYMVKELSDILIIKDAYAVEETINKIAEEKNMDKPQSNFSDELASAYLKEVLISALRLQNKLDVPKLVLEIQDYIKENYSKPITNTTIAQHFKYHSYYLNRLFLASTGKTMHNYIISYRLKMASQMLVSTSYSINEIARTVGFENTSYFSGYFKSVYKLRPLAYRKHNQIY